MQILFFMKHFSMTLFFPQINYLMVFDAVLIYLEFLSDLFLTLAYGLIPIYLHLDSSIAAPGDIWVR